MPSITGTATNANGIPQPNASILLFGGGLEPRVALTGIDGTYTFSGLPAGKYRLTAVVGHSVTEQLGNIVVGQVADTVVDFTILFVNASKNWYAYLIENRWVLLKYAQYFFLGWVGIIFFKGLVTDKMEALGIAQLDNPEKARGIITYLIAVTTISMAAILMLTAIMIGGKEMKERFALGKEILTLLIGILGTIIGFYYGATNKGTTNSSDKDSTAVVKVSTLSIAPLRSDSMMLTIKGRIEGGVQPYTYKTTSNKDDLFKTHQEKTSIDGVISDILELKNKPTADQPVSFTLSGHDKKNKPFNKVQDFVIKK